MFPAMRNACHAAACESALACSQVSKVHTDARMKRLSDVSGVAKLERLFHVVASSGAGRFDGLIMRSTAREYRQSTSPTEWLGLRKSEQGTKEESVRGASCQGIDHDLLYIQFMPSPSTRLACNILKIAQVLGTISPQYRLSFGLALPW